MKGSIFHALQSLVLQHKSIDYWHELLAKNVPEGRTYVSVNNYPDEELNALVTAVCKDLNIDPSVVLGIFGRHLFAHLMQNYYVVVSRFAHFEALILNIDSVIHKEMAKMQNGANLPFMNCMMITTGHIQMHYSSVRKLCLLAEGLIYGAAEHFAMDVKITHPQCQHRGDATCVLNIYYKPVTQNANR